CPKRARHFPLFWPHPELSVDHVAQGHRSGACAADPKGGIGYPFGTRTASPRATQPIAQKLPPPRTKFGESAHGARGAPGERAPVRFPVLSRSLPVPLGSFVAPLALL